MKLTNKQKKKVIEEKVGICEIAGCEEMNNLQVHHIKRASLNGTNDLSNLLVLCERHHKMIHSGEFR